MLRLKCACTQSASHEWGAGTRSPAQRPAQVAAPMQPPAPHQALHQDSIVYTSGGHTLARAYCTAGASQSSPSAHQGHSACVQSGHARRRATCIMPPGRISAHKEISESKQAQDVGAQQAQRTPRHHALPKQCQPGWAVKAASGGIQGM